MLNEEIYKMIAASILLLLSMGLTACNTIGGAGEDLQAAGEAVEEEAED